MLVHKLCKTPIDYRVSHDIEHGDIVGWFCTICVDEFGEDLELFDEQDIENLSLETLMARVS